MVRRVYHNRQIRSENVILTIRETMVLRIVGHKFDNMGLALYQNGQVFPFVYQCLYGFYLTAFPIVRTQNRQYSTYCGQAVQFCTITEADALKIKEYAEKMSLTQGAIYKAIARAGYSAKQLTDKRGNITQKGSAILERIFSDDQQPEPEQLQDQPEKVSAQAGSLDELRTRLKAAEERADKWERLYLELQEKAAEERAEHAQQLKAAQVLLSQQQEIQKLSLMNPIKRLFAGRKKDERGN